MALIHTTSASETFITSNDANTLKINSMSICNTSANDVAELDIYLKKISDNTKFYLVKNLKIPSGINLYLTTKNYPYIFSFNRTAYRLAIQNNGTNPSLTIITK